MSKLSQLQVALNLLSKVKTQSEWTVVIKMICNTFTIGEIDIIADDIGKLEKKGKFKTYESSMEGLHV